VEVEAVLVAAGRRPNVENIGLDIAGVEINEEGVKVDNYLKTTNPDIFAVGDCCSSL
jgi:pyruvate/2-oxoglutarate dehydrogenase complex dihydrolipoamide dehydrogenase (E3) component